MSRLLVLLAAVWTPVLLASPSESGDLAQEVAQAIAEYQEHGEFALPDLDDDQLRRIARGDPVVLTQVLSGQGEDVDALGLVGFQVITEPRKHVWLAMLGATKRADKRLTRAILARGEPGSYTRYQHINLPWPFRDRHWVIQCSKNADVALSTDGLFWEHRWHLENDGLSLLQDSMTNGLDLGLSSRQLQKSIYISTNQGAWLTAEIAAERTLIIGLVAADLGGIFPRPLVTSFTRSRLAAGLKSIKELSLLASVLYKADPVIADGFGVPIAPLPGVQTTQAGSP